METRGNKKYSRLILLINDGWAKTMRFVVKKVAQDNNLNNIDPWGLDEFLDDNMQLLKTELNKQPSKIRRMLSKPTDIEQWDVTLICLVLLEVCVPKLKIHFTRLDSDVKLIRSTRNDIVHSGSPTIADDAYRAKFDQVKTIIREGLKYINNTVFNREIETFIEDVETGIIGSDRAEAVYREWYESDKHLEDKLDTFGETLVKMTQDIAVLMEAYKQKIEPGEMEKKMQEKYLTADEYTTARYRQTGFIAQRAYNRHKMQIATLAEESQQTVNILSKEDELRNEIASHYPRLNEDIRRLKEKRIIVIAGDPGSGKKSIVNLLMGAPLLPLGNTRSSVGIIKLQKGALSVNPQYGISITPKDPMIAQDKTKAAVFVREALSGLTNVSNATETTVCWPLESDILQDDVEIVVESGISDESDILVKYLPKATAFLYIVDSGHSKGIQTEKLKSILRLQQIYCEKYRLQKLKAKRALFLFNKWDQVSCLLENFSDDAKRMKEVDDTVWSNSKTTLQTIWNDIKPEQMMKVSVWQETGLISPCIGIEPHQTERVLAIVYDSFARCEDTARIWLKDFGCFMSTMITRRIDTAYGIKQKSEKLMFVFVKKYEEASFMTKYLVNDVQSEVDRMSRTLSREVVDYIGSPDVRQRMSNWSYGEFPCSLVWDSRQTVKEEVAKAAFRRLSSIILSGKKKEFTLFTSGLQLYVKSKIEAIVKLLKDMDSMQLSLIDMDKSVYKIYHLDLSRYYNWSSRLNSIINEALLTKIFDSQFLFMLLFVALPFFFLAGALTGRTPHTMIMQKTSNDIIDELDSDKICSAIRDQLVDLKTEIRNLAETDFPPMLKSMAEKKGMFTDISKKASSNFDAIVGLK